jgi:hypothetical protein
MWAIREGSSQPPPVEPPVAVGSPLFYPFSRRLVVCYPQGTGLKKSIEANHDPDRAR